MTNAAPLIADPTYHLLETLPFASTRRRHEFIETVRQAFRTSEAVTLFLHLNTTRIGPVLLEMKGSVQAAGSDSPVLLLTGKVREDAGLSGLLDNEGSTTPSEPDSNNDSTISSITWKVNSESEESPAEAFLLPQVEGNVRPQPDQERAALLALSSDEEFWSFDGSPAPASSERRSR